MRSNVLQGRSSSDLQWTAIVNRPTLSFYFSNKCVRLECKCAVSVSALWPKKHKLLKAQLISWSTCFDCVTFLIDLLMTLWKFVFFCALFILMSIYWCSHKWVCTEGNIHRRAINSFHICKQLSGITTAWIFPQVACVCANATVCLIEIRNY